MSLQHESAFHSEADTRQGSYASYVSGFVMSVIFTLVAYLSVTQHWLHGWTLVWALVALAVVQFWVQMLCFLHVGREVKPRWKQLMLFMMIGIVLILVLGSIWIMYNLNYRMTPDQINQYMKAQDGGI